MGAPEQSLANVEANQQESQETWLQKLGAEIKKQKLLYGMGGAGLLSIGFFGFCSDWIAVHSHPGMHWANLADIDQWQCWELGALAWSLLFGVYYYLTFPFTRKDGTDRLLAGILPLFTFSLCTAAAVLLLLRYDTSHFVVVLLIGIFFAGADYLLYRVHEEGSFHKKSYKESFYLADFPMVLALIILLIFHVFHLREKSQADTYKNQMDAFLAGGISFQLIVSNFIFIFSQLGVFRNIWLKR